MACRREVHESQRRFPAHQGQRQHGRLCWRLRSGAWLLEIHRHGRGTQLFADTARVALSGAESADADELAPDGGKAGGNQHDRGVVAEHPAHAAHVGAIGPELAVTGCIENAGQDQQHYSSKIHRRLLHAACRLHQLAWQCAKEKFPARWTRRANRWHPAIIAKNATPAPETGGGLLLHGSETLFPFDEAVASCCQQFVYELKSGLPIRGTANQASPATVVRLTAARKLRPAKRMAGRAPH